MSTALHALVQVRTMRCSDLRFAAALHRQCLPHGLFPDLGIGFMARYLFTYATSPFGLALIAELDGNRIGFLVGSFDERSHRSHVVRQHGTYLAIRAATAMLLRPTVAWRFLRTRLARYAIGFARRRLGPSSAATSASPVSRTAVLAHVAVAPSSRGSGAGSGLVRSFLDRANATEADRAPAPDQGG